MDTVLKDNLFYKASNGEQQVAVLTLLGHISHFPEVSTSALSSCHHPDTA